MGGKKDSNVIIPFNFGHYHILAAYGGGERRIQILGGKPEGKRRLRRPRSRLEDNIKMDVQNVRCGCVDLIELAQDRDRWRALVNMVMNIRVT
jgi:hypothetical protein